MDHVAPSPDWVPRLRAALTAAGYTHDGVADLLGTTAHDALGRNETTPALRRTADGSPLATLVRVFLLQAAVSLDAAEAALPGLVDVLVSNGILERSAGEVVASVDCRPYAADDRDLWVVSDLTPGLDGAPHRVGADHVLGISPASTSLAQLTLRDPVARSLDLGTGCGVQSLHLASHSDRVVATDVNPRALRMARLNCALNDLDGVEVRRGSLLEPVADERFDLITTNPPFVIGPAEREVLAYRDSGLPGDGVVEAIVRGAPGHLEPGGWLQVLANWAIPHGTAWDERLDEWIPDGHAALVVQREVIDPPAYVEMWLKDAGLHGAPDYLARYDAWLDWFDEQRIEGVGFGWLNVRATDGDRTFLDHPYAVEQPVATAVADWGRAQEGRADPADVLVRRPDVLQETTGMPGAADPEAIVLRQQRGLRRARRVDTVEAAVVGACDGELPVGRILDAVAELLDEDPHGLHRRYLPVVTELLREGYLEPRHPSEAPPV